MRIHLVLILNEKAKVGKRKSEKPIGVSEVMVKEISDKIKCLVLL